MSLKYLKQKASHPKTSCALKTHKHTNKGWFNSYTYSTQLVTKFLQPGLVHSYIQGVITFSHTHPVRHLRQHTPVGLVMFVCKPHKKCVEMSALKLWALNYEIPCFWIIEQQTF